MITTAYTQALALVTAAALLAGCTSTVLPATTNKSQSSWATYGDARQAYDAVKIGVSTVGDIKTLGFDPATIPNIKILNYVDVVNLFGPAFKMEDMPDGVRTCVKAREDCVAYNIQVRNIINQRDGFIPADMLGFRKEITTQGWEFNATLVTVGGKVVYKLWNGTPDILSHSKETTPLGPMQNMGGIIPKPF